MKTGFWLGMVAAATFAATMHAQAPSGSTGLCKDGTYTQASMRKGACASHGGVKTWYPTDGGAKHGSPNGTVNPAPASDPAGQTNMDGVMQKGAKVPARQTPAAPANGGTLRTQAPGGGPGLVWVDGKTNKYYCAADPNYGRTKTGKYVSEADAKSGGAMIAKKQNCSM